MSAALSLGEQLAFPSLGRTEPTRRGFEVMGGCGIYTSLHCGFCVIVRGWQPSIASSNFPVVSWFSSRSMAPPAAHLGRAQPDGARVVRIEHEAWHRISPSAQTGRLLERIRSMHHQHWQHRVAFSAWRLRLNCRGQTLRAGTPGGAQNSSAKLRSLLACACLKILPEGVVRVMKYHCFLRGKNRPRQCCWPTCRPTVS